MKKQTFCTGPILAQGQQSCLSTLASNPLVALIEWLLLKESLEAPKMCVCVLVCVCVGRGLICLVLLSTEKFPKVFECWWSSEAEVTRTHKQRLGVPLLFILIRFYAPLPPPFSFPLSFLSQRFPPSSQCFPFFYSLTELRPRSPPSSSNSCSWSCLHPPPHNLLWPPVFQTFSQNFCLFCNLFHPFGFYIHVSLSPLFRKVAECWLTIVWFF